MTEKQLTALANDLCQKWWGVEFDGMILVRHRRWKNTNGRIRFPSAVIGFPELIPAPIIEFCSKRNSERTQEEVVGTLLHELVHWRLHAIGVPHRDKDVEFVREALRVGAPISQTIKAQRAYERYMRDEA